MELDEEAGMTDGEDSIRVNTYRWYVLQGSLMAVVATDFGKGTEGLTAVDSVANLSEFVGKRLVLVDKIEAESNDSPETSKRCIISRWTEAGSLLPPVYSEAKAKWNAKVSPGHHFPLYGMPYTTKSTVFVPNLNNHASLLDLVGKGLPFTAPKNPKGKLRESTMSPSQGSTSVYYLLPLPLLQYHTRSRLRLRHPV
ncbi:hypothetical protein TNCV_230221 [Trichonephila clavipes]|nr:hypothetical protein TNCV_230221 [Trichonephila clavipes]